MNTRIRESDTGRFATVKNLLGRNGDPAIAVGEKDLQSFLQDARKAAFERAAAKGRQLLLAATQATKDGDAARALAVVRKDQYACAAYLAKANHLPVSAHGSQRRSGFSELELMERFWQEKIAEADGKTPSP